MAFYLGRSDRRSAASVFRRVLSLAVWAGVAIAAALLAARGRLPGLFSGDAQVAGLVSAVRGAAG